MKHAHTDKGEGGVCERVGNVRDVGSVQYSTTDMYQSIKLSLSRFGFGFDQG